MLLAGAATAPLTGGLGLPVGARLPQPDGWLEVRREPLARALVVDDNYRQAALVAVDLLAIDQDLQRLVGERVWDATRIPPAAVLIVPTGNQQAPLAATLSGLPPRPDEYVAAVVEQIASAVIYAARRRVPAAVGWVRGEVSPTLPAGPLALRVDTVDGQPLAVLAELPWLPGEVGRELDTDYPGPAAAALARLRPGVHLIGLLGGAAGQTTPGAADEAGEALGARLWATALTAETDPAATLAVARGKAAVTNEAPDLDQALARLALAEVAVDMAAEPWDRRAAEAELERARQAVAVAESGALREREIEVFALRLGEGAVVGSSLLLSAAAAAAVRGVCPTGELTLVASQVNGCLGVLATAERRLPELEQWYSPVPFAPASVDSLAAAAARALARADRSG